MNHQYSSSRTHSFVTSIRRELFMISILAAIALFAWSMSASSHGAGFRSVELRFTDASAKGLQIVPASCPSNPHDGGQCSGGGACSLNFEPSPVAQGQSSMLYWWAPSGNDPYTLSYPGGSNSVPYSGSGSVGGESSKTYTLSYHSATGGGDTGPGPTISCSATLTVCPAGQTVQNGQCVSNAGCTISWSPSTVTQGQHSTLSWSAAHAGTIYYPGGSFPAPASGTGGADGGSQSMTYRFVDGTNGQQCQATLTVCPAGQVVQNGQCVPVQQCTPSYFCQGSNLYYKNSQCTDSFIQACAYGCAGGQCSPPPHPVLSIRAQPSLVHPGATTQVIWSATNITTCSVTGTNGDSWTGATAVGCSGTSCNSGASGKTSGAINDFVMYTFSCTGLDGTHPVATTTVNIIPNFQEQ